MIKVEASALGWTAEHYAGPAMIRREHKRALGWLCDECEQCDECGHAEGCSHAGGAA